MVPSAFLHTLAFPWILLSASGEVVDAQDGALFKLSEQARDPSSLSYCRSAAPGWSRCPKGFAVYCRMLPDGSAKLVLHGLKVDGVSTVSGKSDVLSIRTGPAEVERYLNSAFIAFSRIDAYIQSIIGRSVHEVRGINKDVKSATEDILYLLGQKEIDLYDIGSRVNNIKALSEILTARTDFLDYFANPALALIPDRAIQVHNKFFKTTESLASRAAAKDVAIRRMGRSDGLITGLRVFEVT
jgi:hypothetical protein